jgi:ubiquinone/menaquinone biosynthesis C-methylase UbiE
MPVKNETLPCYRVLLMSSYIEWYAEVYDQIYADKPYDKEAAFIHECIQKYRHEESKLLLELACGTGTHAFFMEKYGYRLIATDYSESMIEQAKRKKRESASGIEFRLQDMRELHIEEKPFDVIYCLFDSIGYVQRNDDITRVLKNVNRHLKQDGLFIFEFWHAPAMLRNYDPVRTLEIAFPDGVLHRITKTRLDIEKQLAHVRYHLIFLKNDGTYLMMTEEQANRFFQVQEMALFLEASGLRALRWFSGFQFEMNISEDTFHIVALAEKNREIK